MASMDLAYALWPNATSGGQHGVCSSASPCSGGSKEGRCGSIRCVSTSFHVCYAWREAPVLVVVIIPWTLVVLRGMDDKMHVDPIQDLRVSFASTVGCLSSLAYMRTREGKAVITKSKKTFIYALVRMTFLL